MALVRRASRCGVCCSAACNSRFGATTVRSHDPVRPLILAVVLFFVYAIAFRPRLQRGGGPARAPVLRIAVWIGCDWRAGCRRRFRCDGRPIRPADPIPPDTSARRTAGCTGPARPLPVARQRCRGHRRRRSLAPLGYMAAPGSTGDRADLRARAAVDDGRPVFGDGSARSVPRGAVVCRRSSCGRRSCSVVESAAWPSAALAALFVAVSPIVLFQALSPMTDVPIGALWTAAAVAALSGLTTVPFARRPRCRDCRAGSSQPAARARRLRRCIFCSRADVARRADPRGHVRRARRPGGARRRGAQLRWYGGPFNSGYGSAGQLYSVRQHLAEPAALSCMAGPIAFAAVVVVPASAGDVEPARCDRTGVRFAYLLIAATWLLYLPYFAFEEWWYLRFLLPAIPAMLVLQRSAMMSLGRLGRFRGVGC